MTQRVSTLQAETMQWPVLSPADARPGLGPVVLNRPVCLVGARSRVHLPLPSPLVSKAHALIVTDADGVYVRDLASRNHTYVNDSKVREARLDPSDMLRIGPFTFRCQAGFDRPHDGRSVTAAPAALSVEAPDGRESRVPVKRRIFVIGSRPECDLVLPSSDAWPAHAVIVERGGRRFLRDLNTSEQTYVNGTPTHETELHGSDEIRIGSATLMYRAADAATAPVATTSSGSIATEDESQASSTSEIPLAVEEIELQDEPAAIAAPSDADAEAEDQVTAPQGDSRASLPWEPLLSDAADVEVASEPERASTGAADDLDSLAIPLIGEAYRADVPPQRTASDIATLPEEEEVELIPLSVTGEKGGTPLANELVAEQEVVTTMAAVTVPGASGSMAEDKGRVLSGRETAGAEAPYDVAETTPARVTETELTGELPAQTFDDTPELPKGEDDFAGIALAPEPALAASNGDVAATHDDEHWLDVSNDVEGAPAAASAPDCDAQQGDAPPTGQVAAARITRLVTELAGTASDLEAAWREYQTESVREQGAPHGAGQSADHEWSNPPERTDREAHGAPARRTLRVPGHQ